MKRFLVPVLFLSLMAPSLSAQRQKVTINLTTPEGQLLQQVSNESDDAKKLALMEQFLTQYPSHEGVVLIYSQMVPACTRLGQFDKALEAAGKSLALDPADIETAFAAVKAAEAKKDPDAVLNWAVRSSEIAGKAAQAPKTEDEDDNSYKQRVDAAKALQTNAEYALFSTAAGAADPAKKVDLLKTLEERAPGSTYLPQAYPVYFQALLQSGNLAAGIALAEKLIAKDQANELMLGTAADYYLHENRELQKVLDYSSKLSQMVNAKTKPAEVTDADWQKGKDYLLGWGLWMTGAVYSSKREFAEANKVLREALPLLEGNEVNRAGALYNLGIANTQLKKVSEAVRFYRMFTPDVLR